MVRKLRKVRKVFQLNSMDNTVANIIQEGIETVESAYQVFLKWGGEHLQHFVDELETAAETSLGAERIRDYLTVIFQEQGFAMAQVTGALSRLLISLLR